MNFQCSNFFLSFHRAPSSPATFHVHSTSSTLEEALQLSTTKSEESRRTEFSNVNSLGSQHMYEMRFVDTTCRSIEKIGFGAASRRLNFDEWHFVNQKPP